MGVVDNDPGNRVIKCIQNTQNRKYPAHQGQHFIVQIFDFRQEHKEELEKLTESVPVEEMIQMGQVKNSLQQEIQDILNKMNLMAEDIKGTMVDTGA